MNHPEQHRGILVQTHDRMLPSDEHIKGKTFDIMIVGPKDKVDFNLLKTYGDVKELTVDEVFNY